MVMLNYGQQEISQRVNRYHAFGKHWTKESVIIKSYNFLPQTIYFVSYTLVPHVVHCFTKDAGSQNFLKDLEDKLV